jgi:hypothetical protein
VLWLVGELQSSAHRKERPALELREGKGSEHRCIDPRRILGGETLRCEHLEIEENVVPNEDFPSEELTNLREDFLEERFPLEIRRTEMGEEPYEWWELPIHAKERGELRNFLSPLVAEKSKLNDAVTARRDPCRLHVEDDEGKRGQPHAL